MIYPTNPLIRVRGAARATVERLRLGGENAKPSLEAFEFFVLMLDEEIASTEKIVEEKKPHD
jgi:hypothetical protein